MDNDAEDELEYTILTADESHSTHFSIHPKQGLISLQNSISNLGLFYCRFTMKVIYFLIEEPKAPSLLPVTLKCGVVTF